jgi:hypothetical protein
LRFRITYGLASGIGELRRVSDQANLELAPGPSKDIVKRSARFVALPAPRARVHHHNKRRIRSNDARRRISGSGNRG